MKKLLSLIKACMTDNMNLFKIKTKNQSKRSKIILPFFLVIALFFSIWSYADMIMEPLAQMHLEYVGLTIFVLFTTILTFVEGIYKSGNLLFNCKDDDLLLSLPLKKSTVLFVRIFKFYVFELLYNSVFLLPAMVAYIRYVNVDWTYYLVSIIMLLLLPIIPIIVSCVIGGIISASSSKFKFKKMAQTIITTIILLAVMYASFNLQSLIGKLAENATSINDTITKLYYPAGAYVKLITDFNITDLLLFIVINIALFATAIVVLGKVYFKINSSVKVVKASTNNSNYKIKTNSPMKCLIKKEINRFINSPVFIINAGFGLVLFVFGCILACIKFDGLVTSFAEQGIEITTEQIKTFIPVIAFGFICFASLMSSITSSMISLEGKSFNILKSLPVKPFTIIFAKVLTAVIIMIPFILIGDLVLFIKFNFNIIEIIMLLITSFVLPLFAETLGIIVNLKYPKMDAENDTEVVKQSMSSMVAVFAGMGLTALTIFTLYKCIQSNLPEDLVILGGLGIYTLLLICLLIYLNKKGSRDFENINV